MTLITQYTKFPQKPKLLRLLIAIALLVSQFMVNAQAVSEIITDYNGWWKTSSVSVSSVLPDNHHNLLSFSYNGTRYSTGVNDAALSAHGETFVSGLYQALPLQNVNGTVNSSTKIGLGAMADGVYNGAGAAPSRNLGPYLNDGANGLDMGTCVANLPAGTMFMSVSNIQAGNIGDGVPDILVTQVADPSTSFDSYEFTDVNGVRVGNSLNIVLNNIPAIGNWVADFYEATGATVLAPTFTQTQRAIRLWAADFSSFGLNASNIANVAYFKINLSGTSDIAFVAYNTTTISVQQVLALLPSTSRIRPEIPEREQSMMNLMPNPAFGKVTVRHPAAQEGDRFAIYSAGGLLVKQGNCSAGSRNTALNLSSLRFGSYHVVLWIQRRKLAQMLVVQ